MPGASGSVWLSFAPPSLVSSRGDGILRDEMAHGLGNALLLVLLPDLPGPQALHFPGDFLVVAFDAGPQLGLAPCDLLFELRVFGILLRAELFEILLQHPLVGVERPIAAYRVLDDLVHRYAGGVEGDQDGFALDLGRQRADVLALEHVRD